MNLSNLGLPIGMLKIGREGVIPLTDLFRNVLTILYTPYFDTCCDIAGVNPQPVRVNPVTNSFETFNGTDWVVFPTVGQVITITPGTNITSVTGIYPNFIINAATQGGVITNGSGTTVNGTAVDLVGALTTPAVWTTDATNFISINGGKLDFTPFITYVNGGNGNTGVEAVFVGYEAGTNNTGSHFTSVGSGAGSFNTGSNFTSVGTSAGGGNTGGNFTGIGNGAGVDNIGDDFTGVGNGVGFNNTGTEFTGLGVGAGFNNTYNNVTVLGAGVSALADNQVVLGNNSVTTTLLKGKVGVNINVPTSTMHINGSFAATYVAKVADYTATIDDYVIDCTANTFTITLPIITLIIGRIYKIKNSGVGTISVVGTGGDLIDGVPAQSLNASQHITVMASLTQWIII